MKHRHWMALALLIGVASVAAPRVHEGAFFVLDVPDGFEGPQVQAPGPGANVTAFVRPHDGRADGTLLQVSSYDFGQALADMPESERANVAETYLQQFLASLGRRRDRFAVATPTRLTLDGIPAARAEWTGEANGQPMSGVMYCVVVGTVVVSLHTQQLTDAPVEHRSAALRAIEAVRFRATSATAR